MASGMKCQVRLARLLKPDSLALQALRVQIVHESAEVQPPGGVPAFVTPETRHDAALVGILE